MNVRILSFFCLCFSGTVFGQTAEKFWSFGATYLGESVGVVSGGLSRGATYEGMATLGMDVDTELAGWFSGGHFRLSGANTHGGTPSERLIGDFQVASNIEAGNLTFLQECWYRQELGRWSFIVGMQDLNVELVASECASLFLNSSLGTPSVIASNVPSPIFPLTSLGLQVHYRFNERAGFKVAVFDGMPEDFDTNPYNVVWRWDSNDGYLTFAEFNVMRSPKKKHPGFLRVGAYWHDHLRRSTALSHSNNYGCYLTADQQVYSTSSGRKLSTFVLLGLSPKSKNENSYFAGGGIHAAGCLKGRKEDVFGLAFAHAGLNGRTGETVLEASYRMQCNTILFVQPDVQYIVHPSATAMMVPNALVALLRFGLEF